MVKKKVSTPGRKDISNDLREAIVAERWLTTGKHSR